MAGKGANGTEIVKPGGKENLLKTINLEPYGEDHF
jgi:hypothetical protein